MKGWTALEKNPYRVNQGITEGITESEAETLLKNYSYSQGRLKADIEEFISALPDPLQKFVICRYKHRFTMEKTAEKMNYSIRNIYVFRKKTLKKWVTFLFYSNNYQ